MLFRSFREGRRSNEAMTAVAKTLKDDDLRGFAAVIDSLPPVAPPPAATPPDPARMNKARELARQHKCVFCHGDDLSGGQQVPRIGGQREDYLRESLRGFKSGQRPGYTQAMIEAVSRVSVEDLDTLAYYAARAYDDALETIARALAVRGDPIRRAAAFFLANDSGFVRVCGPIVADLRTLTGS